MYIKLEWIATTFPNLDVDGEVTKGVSYVELPLDIDPDTIEFNWNVDEKPK